MHCHGLQVDPNGPVLTDQAEIRRLVEGGVVLRKNGVEWGSEDSRGPASEFEVDIFDEQNTLETSGEDKMTLANRLSHVFVDVFKGSETDYLPRDR